MVAPGTMWEQSIGNEMNWRRCAILLAISVLIGTSASSAHAQTRIGEAVIIKNEVLRVAESSGSQINVGDGVLRDETVQTGVEGAARFVMADSTNLSLGANATLKLDRTVFNDEHSYRDIAIRLTSGAFRFVTGHSEKTAYKITTPLGTIGVRGTILDILSQRGQTTVVLQEGAASVCTLGFQCMQLTEPGDTAIITLTAGKTKITKTGNAPWTFASVCAGAGAVGLCTVTDVADNSPPSGYDANGVLCGR
jgi:ferric-dicitrate binding protein FerR (iron transport regulator)